MKSSWGEVALFRSASAMPLVEASTEPAAYFGLGYAQAADDTETLLRQYLLVRGELRLADGDEAAERDANQHRWGILAESRRAFESLPLDFQDCYRAFIAGVQTWLDEHPAEIPSWAPPLEPALPIGVNRTIMLFWVIADAVQALRSAGVELPPVVSELDRTPMTPGSNAWVVFPWRTKADETFLVSDPHLPFGGAHSFHEATVIAGDLHYTGFTFLGAMLPALAHNAHCGWGVTTGGPRVSDAYRVADTEAPEIRINGIRSPIIARHLGSAYAICSPYTDLAAETESQLRQMVRAHSVAELRDALDRAAFPPQNLLAADASGEGFYLRTGRVPRRPDGARGVLEVHQLWAGFLRQDELVQAAHPASGYLQSCNSAPDTATPGMDAARWSADAFNDVAGRQTERSARSIEILRATIDVDIADVTAWAVEDLWPDTRTWQGGLADAMAALPDRVAALSRGRRALLRTLLDFDGHASPSSVAASAWLAWRTTIATWPVTPVRLRDLVDDLDPELLLGALESCPVETRPYGEINRFESGAPGRGGGFVVRPSAPGDLGPSTQLPLRATYFADGKAVGGGPALRIVRYGTEGMRSWSLLLPKNADVFARGEVLPTAFFSADATLERRFEETSASGEQRATTAGASWRG